MRQCCILLLCVGVCLGLLACDSASNTTVTVGECDDAPPMNGICSLDGGAGQWLCEDGSWRCDIRGEVCNRVDDDGDSKVDEGLSCECFAREYRGQEYLACVGDESKRSAHDAQAFCRSKGYALLEVSNADENAFVTQMLRKNEPVWIGLFETGEEGCFSWQSGAPHWCGGSGGGPIDGAFHAFDEYDNQREPNNQPSNSTLPRDDVSCIRLKSDGKWRDQSCSAKHGVICERTI